MKGYGGGDDDDDTSKVPVIIYWSYTIHARYGVVPLGLNWKDGTWKRDNRVDHDL